MSWLLIVTPVALLAVFGAAIWMESHLLGQPTRVPPKREMAGAVPGGPESATDA